MSKAPPDVRRRGLTAEHLPRLPAVGALWSPQALKTGWRLGRQPADGREATVTVSVTVTAMVAFLVAAALFVGSNLGPARIEVDAALRENAQLVARQQALRGVAFDLAGQVRWRVEKGRGLARLAGASGHPGDVECPLPPAKEASNEAVLAWLSELGSWLEPSERPVLSE